jgi:PAS domain S-box-containing protein
MKNGNALTGNEKWLPLGYVAAFIFLAVGIGVIGSLYLKNQFVKTRQVSENELSAIGGLKIAQISKWYLDQFEHVNYFFNSPLIPDTMMNLRENPSDLESRIIIKDCLASIQQNFHYNRVLLFDSNQQFLFSFPEAKTWVGPNANKFIADTLSEGAVMISDIHLSKMVPDTVDMDIFIPLIPFIPLQAGSNESKRAIGVLMLEINPHDYLFPLVQSWPTPSKTAETLLVRKDGDEVVYLNELRHRKGTALKLRFPIADKTNLPAVMAVNGKEGIFEGWDYRGVDVIADIGPVPGTPWFLISKVDKNEIYSALKKEAAVTLALILILILATALGVGFIWKQRDANLLRKSHEELERRVVERTADLNKSLQEISDLYNNAPCGYHSLDRDGLIVKVNDTELKWIGYERDGVVNKLKFPDILTQKSLDSFHENFPKFKERGWVKDLELEVICNDGTILPVIINSTAIRDAEGNYLMSRSTLFDMTYRKRIEKELEKLNRSLSLRTSELETVNKELEAFSYSVSHDLKSPLRSVDGFAKMLEEDYSGKLDDEGKRLLKVIRDSAKEMGQLISDLLEFSRMTRKDIHKTNIDMDELVRDVYSHFENDLKGRDVSLDADSLPEIYGDPAMIREVLVNLLSNAFKFTRPKKVAVIKIESTSEGDDIVFTTSDNGVGFDMSYKDKLFSVFQRLHSVSEFEGTGIGLALVQRIIQRHGGKVWAESELGKGSKFSFSIPKIK